MLVVAVNRRNRPKRIQPLIFLIVSVFFGIATSPLVSSLILPPTSTASFHAAGATCLSSLPNSSSSPPSRSRVLPRALESIVSTFERLPPNDDPVRYKQLLYLSGKLPPIDPSLKVPENLVSGCQSTVHLHCVYSPSSNTLSYSGSSDSSLTGGLVALLCCGLTGASPSEVQLVDAKDVLGRTGIRQSLTPGRTSGFASMLSLAQRKGAEAARKRDDAAAAAATADPSDQAAHPLRPPSDSPPSDPLLAKVEGRLALLRPSSLTVTDDSASHAGHPGAAGGKRHLGVRIAAECFEGLSAVKRHQLVYALIGELMETEIHAIRIEAKTLAETKKS